MKPSRPWTDMAVEYNVPDRKAIGFVGGIVLPVPVFRFETYYHPYLCDAITHLNRGGIDELLRWPIGKGTPATQPVDLTKKFVFEAKDQYDPDSTTVATPYPREILDFGVDGRTAYSQYNWELFFHVPFTIACKLS